MDVECPYCSAIVDVTSLEQHVRTFDGDGHGPHDTVPVDGVDNPWQLRLDYCSAPSPDTESADDVPSVEHIVNRSRRGRCPACDDGVLGFKGGSGFFSSGRRRLACPNCGWQSPDWITVRD